MGKAKQADLAPLESQACSMFSDRQKWTHTWALTNRTANATGGQEELEIKIFPEKLRYAMSSEGQLEVNQISKVRNQDGVAPMLSEHDHDWNLRAEFQAHNEHA